MSKRRNRDPGGVRQLHPQQSFQQLVGDATLAKLAGYIDEQIQGFGQAVQYRVQRSVLDMTTRMIALEEILFETVPAITKENLSERITLIQDRMEGLTRTDEPAKAGDRVRVSVTVRAKPEDEIPAKASRFLVDELGSGQTVGKEIEDAIIGMKAGETKEIRIGKDQKVAGITLNTVSRPTEAETPTPVAAEPKESADDVSQDAG